MTTLLATVRAGRIRFDEPSDLPDGSQIEVTLRPRLSEVELAEDTSPEGIERWIKSLEAIPAPIMTDDEWSAWNARRMEDRKLEFAMESKRESRLFGAAE